MSNTVQLPQAPAGARVQAWPLEVRALLDSMRKFASAPKHERRRENRRSYQVEGSILYLRNGQSEPARAAIYTRDATDKAIAFVTQTMFEAGQVVTLEVPAPEGVSQKLNGRILRCRQFREGWYDGVFLTQPPPERPVAKRKSRWIPSFGRA